MSEESTSVKILDTNVVKMDEVHELIDYKTDARFRLIDSRSSSQVSGLLQYVPQAVAKEAMNGTYRVEFPEGISGVLVRHEGGYLSVMRGTEGKFSGHATFVPTSETVPAMLGMFTALSVVTSQYFLAQINQNLIDVQHKLDQILGFLYDDKACDIYAELQAVQTIYANYPAIMKHPEQRTASIATIQHAKVMAERNIQFYYRDMDRRIATELGDKNVPFSDLKNAFNGEEMKKLANGLSNELNSYNQVINLYSICSILEIVLSQNFEKSYLDYIEDDLNRHFKNHTSTISSLKGKLSALQTKKFGSKLNDVVQGLEDLVDKESPEKKYQSVIGQIRSTYNSKAEYRILPDGTVYQKIA